MRIRTIKPEFFKHDVVAQMQPMTRILFIGLWCLADSEGRMEDRPKRIGVEVLPYDTKANIEGMLAELAGVGLIRRYSAGGHKLIEIPAFNRHQRLSGTEAQAKSRFPAYGAGSTQEAPAEAHGSSEEATTKQSGSSEEAAGSTAEALWQAGNGRETEGKGKEGRASHCLPFPSPEFAEAWALWEQHRREIKKPIKPAMIAALFEQLTAIGEARAIAAIKHTVAMGWQGLREPERPAGANDFSPEEKGRLYAGMNLSQMRAAGVA
jgi:hypothetical protein